MGTESTVEPIGSGKGPISRRQFFGNAAGAASVAFLVSTGVAVYGERSRALPTYALRPPGALEGRRFLASCSRCGLCVRDCPYGALRLSRLGEPVPAGTPYFVAREIPCEMCEDIPCINACPTGALDRRLEDIYKARMGLAVVVDHETCLNYLGLRCDTCYRACPLIDEAITLEPQHNKRSGRHTIFVPVVHSEACTGCGKCERVCVLDTAAIKVFPRGLAKAELGRHYRLGWEEKEKAGGALVPGVLDLPDRLPGGG